MAKLFICIDPKTKKKHEYIFGETKKFREFLNVLEKSFNSKNLNLNNKDLETLKEVLTKEEIQKFKKTPLLNFECTIRPFTDGKNVQNMPFIHLKYKNQEYTRKYSNLKILNIAKDSINLPSPIDGTMTMEVVEIKEIN